MCNKDSVIFFEKFIYKKTDPILIFLLNLENTQMTFLGYLRNAGSEKIFMSLVVESLFKFL